MLRMRLLCYIAYIHQLKFIVYVLQTAALFLHSVIAGAAADRQYDIVDMADATIAL